MDFLHPMGDEIIRLLHPKNEERILDVASGKGEPGLTIASMLNGGKVIITDLAAHKLEIAREHATSRRIQNIDTRAFHGCELPFAGDTFDSICYRFGFMFFPDMLMAAKEMFRVLKPVGKLATSV